MVGTIDEAFEKAKKRLLSGLNVVQMNTIHVDVVSAEEAIFSGEARLWPCRAKPASSASTRATRR
jgi:hypothetical protein